MKFLTNSIRNKLFLLLFSLLIFNVFCFLLISKNIENIKYDAARIDVAGKNRMLSQKMLSFHLISKYASNEKKQFLFENRLKDVTSEFENNISLLDNGGYLKTNGIQLKITASPIHIKNDLKRLRIFFKNIKNRLFFNNIEDEYVANYIDNQILNSAQDIVVDFDKIYQNKIFYFKVMLSILLGINFVLFILIFRFFTTNFTRPIALLSDSFINSKTVDKNDKILLREDEIGIMAKSINLLVNNLRDKNQELIYATKNKELFLANMSHEIRTPMNSILGFTNLLANTSISKKQRDFIQNIKINASNLLVIINDILDISKIEAGKIQLEKVNFSIVEIANQVINACEEKAKSNGNQLILNIDELLNQWVNGDPTRLYQILLNLVSNAVKFTKSGKIIVTIQQTMVSESEYNIFFSVKDTGIGIAQENLNKMFETFTQASNSTTRKYGGTGLGLSIVKQLVELQGGKIELESQLGKGSTFYFSITYPIGMKPELFEAKNRSVSEEILQKLKTRQFTVLLVDDIIFNRTVAVETILEWGLNLNILEAENGLEALKILAETNVDLILMDIQMPEMDGHTATQRIRKDFEEPKSSVPIIAMSAHASENEIRVSREAGMNDYITKPFDPEDFLKKVVVHIITQDELDNIILEEVTSDDIHVEVDYQNNFDLFNNENDELTNSVVNKQFIIDFTKGNQDRIDKMVRMFLKFTPDEMEKMKNLYVDEKYEELGILVHSFKAKFTYMGLPQLSVIAKEIENNAKNQQNIEQIGEMIYHLISQCEIAYQELNSLLIS